MDEQETHNIIFNISHHLNPVYETISAAADYFISIEGLIMECMVFVIAIFFYRST